MAAGRRNEHRFENSPMSADGFLGRWARRKSDVQLGKPLEQETPSAPLPGAVAAVATARQSPTHEAQPAAVASAPAQALAEPPAEIKLPTLQDVQQLSLDGDFKPFMARGVTPEVKNAAMRKLFTDPHYNIMDGLDTYIEDYSISEPIPESMLRQMASAKFMNLFNEDTDEDKALKGHAVTPPPATPPPAALAETPDAQPAQSVAESTPDSDSDPAATSAQQPPATQAVVLSADQPPKENDVHHPDLRLQPDHAAQPHVVGHGTQ